MTERSPAAQAVVNAYAKCVSEWFKLTETEKSSSHYHASGLAASLRAAADQVLPYEPEPKWYEPVRSHFNRQRIRRRLLAIAAELESVND